MECIQIIQNGGSKMADASSSFFSNKWRHHGITTIVEDYLYVSQLLVFIKHLCYYLSIFRFTSTLIEENLDSANQFNNIMS